MQGATTDDEPMGRNPGTSEAANLTALKVRGCDLAARFADLIEASGHVPCFKAVHMNAPSTRVKSIEKLLAPRAVPHMRLIALGNGPRQVIGLRTWIQKCKNVNWIYRMLSDAPLTLDGDFRCQEPTAKNCSS